MSTKRFYTPGGLVFVREGDEVALYEDVGMILLELGRWDRDTWISAALHTWTSEDYELFKSHWRALFGARDSGGNHDPS